MSRRTAGIVLIFIAALLYATRFLAAAIFGSGVSSWSAELFRSMLQYVGNGPVVLAIIALTIGVAYLVWGELGNWLKRP